MIEILRGYYPQDPFLVNTANEPFRTLITCLLSQRTRDEISFAVADKLFSVAKTPEEMLKLPPAKLAKIVRPAGFRDKARSIRAISRVLIEKFGGQVPQDEDSLLSLQGIGRKTANLVRGRSFGIPCICVDTHVHRISNRLGWVKTKTPEETEKALEKVIPRDLWIELNRLLVLHGRSICKPRNPKCALCHVESYCKKRI